MIGIFGGKGSGKSLFAAYLAQLWHKQDGREILYFPNDFNHVSGEPITLVEMFGGSEKMRGKIVIWDEAQILLNKFRAASTANRTLIGFMQQVRKQGVFLIYTSNAPNQLDKGLAEQTDFHAYCKKYEDPRCKAWARKPGRARAHLKACNDWMRIHWVDTAGKTGADRRHRDNRRRVGERLPGILRYYGLYNTYASVSPQEIAAFDKDAIQEAVEEQKSGESFDDFVLSVRQWIVEAVEQGAKRAVPATMAKTLSEQTGEKISAERLGRALRRLGLARKRSAGGVSYELPSREELAIWTSIG